MFEAGIPEVVKTARALGIKNYLNAVPSLVLGTSDVSLYEMVGVYATFAERGNKNPLHSILRIEDKNGNVLYDSKEDSQLEGEQVVEPEYVDLLNDMLLNVSVKGTGSRIYNNYRIPYPICGKTGTTQNQSDGWYIGHHKDLAIGAWVGTKDRRIHFRNLGTGSGGRTALPMVGALYEYAAKEGYLSQKKLHYIDTNDCPDFIPDPNNIEQQIVYILNEMDKIRKDIMGESDQSEGYAFNRKRTNTNDKDWNKKYRQYKRAVRDLEVKLKDLRKELREMN
jgi:penicillin-binding protein 1A